MCHVPSCPCVSLLQLFRGYFQNIRLSQLFYCPGPVQIRDEPRWREMEGVGSSLFSDYFCFNYCSPVIIWRWLYLVVTKIPWPASTSARSLWDPHQLIDELSCSLSQLSGGRIRECLFSIIQAEIVICIENLRPAVIWTLNIPPIFLPNPSNPWLGHYASQVCSRPPLRCAAQARQSLTHLLVYKLHPWIPAMFVYGSIYLATGPGLGIYHDASLLKITRVKMWTDWQLILFIVNLMKENSHRSCADQSLSSNILTWVRTLGPGNK